MIARQNIKNLKETLFQWYNNIWHIKEYNGTKYISNPDNDKIFNKLFSLLNNK